MARVLLIFALLFVVHIIIADAINFVGFNCGILSKEPSFAYRRDNLTNFFWDLPSQGGLTRFYNTTEDYIPNKLYSFFQCRYDLSLDDCELCIEDAVHRLVTWCILDMPGGLVFGDGVMYRELCMVQYAYNYPNLFSFNKANASIDSVSALNDEVSNIPGFNKVLANAIDDVIKGALKKDNGVYFAKTETNVTSSEKLYCLAQCGPILDDFECEECLRTAFSEFKNFSAGRVGTMVIFRFCQLRYDNEPLSVREGLLTTSPSSLPSAVQDHEAAPQTSKSWSSNSKTIEHSIIIVISLSAIFGFILWRFLRKRPQETLGQKPKAIDELRHEQVATGDMEDIGTLESLQFDFKGVQDATSNFSMENKLGQGGFGAVYKGKFSNGEAIAVKRLSKNSPQGGFEFKNEVILLAKLQHRNLVKLLGFCVLEEEKILIYEFLSNSSLDRFLYDPLRRASLKWELRFRIITGISRGLLYLHEDSRLKIIHRDLKASNILLDEAMNAKIADFGIAKLFDSDQTRGSTMRIAGTYGYMAPEYALAGQFSVKSDVYSFGVIILEIMSGQRNNFFRDEQTEGLLYRAWRLWNEDAILELVDPLLSNKFSEEEAKLCIQIGLLCVQEDATQRPRMASVVHALEGKSITLPSPNAPHVFTICNSDIDTTPSNYDSMPEDEVRLRNHEESDGVYTGPMDTTDLYPR